MKTPLFPTPPSYLILGLLRIQLCALHNFLKFDNLVFFALQLLLAPLHSVHELHSLCRYLVDCTRRAKRDCAH